MESAQSLVRLQAEKFDLLQPSGGRRSTQPASPALTASLKALEELKGVIAIHLKVSRRLVEGGLPVCLHSCGCWVWHGKHARAGASAARRPAAVDVSANRPQLGGKCCRMTSTVPGRGSPRRQGSNGAVHSVLHCMFRR